RQDPDPIPMGKLEAGLHRRTQDLVPRTLPQGRQALRQGRNRPLQETHRQLRRGDTPVSQTYPIAAPSSSPLLTPSTNARIESSDAGVSFTIGKGLQTYFLAWETHGSSTVAYAEADHATAIIAPKTDSTKTVNVILT